MVVILTLLGAAAVAAGTWCTHHTGRELGRRRQVARVRAALAGRITVAELRARCGADSLPLLPTPRTALGAPDPAAERGSTPVRAA